MNGMMGDSYIPIKDDHLHDDPFVNGDRDEDVTVGYEQMSYHGLDLAQKVSAAIKPMSKGRLCEVFLPIKKESRFPSTIKISNLPIVSVSSKREI